MPVIEDGQTVDIVAWRAGRNRKKLDVWGCVTHSSRFLNRDAIYDTTRAEPLRVHEHWWQWLRAGCSGVVPLRVSAIPELCNAGDVVVGDSAHALQLLYEAYLWPTNADPNGSVWNAARQKGRKHIWIDDEQVAA
jgi:hypothetical protein